MTPLSRLLPEIQWDRPAGLWRLTVSGEPVTGDDGQPKCWITFNEAFNALREWERAAPLSDSLDRDARNVGLV
ncbi:hypothetical protein EDD99_4364 [Streptomyces sp. 846.5]|nr:hypothetical protein EDD99_4364 [Streptomyces sp. 846.5]